jgi:streptomycin 6-kinase
VSDADILPAAWKVPDPVLIADTVSSHVWKVRRQDGTFAVAKALKDFDDYKDELRGAHLLDWRGGVGMVRLLALEGRTMLLEHADGQLLTETLNLEGDRRATDIAAEVMAAIHAPSQRPAPPDLQPLRDRFAALFVKANADRTAGRASAYVEAARVAERLLAIPRSVKPLHGDLHHDNIIMSHRGWLAIDPKGVFGDTGFDAANLFYNPVGRLDLCIDPERIAHMATVFARTLGQDEGAILDHAFAYGCLSSAWHESDGNTSNEAAGLAIAGAIRAVALSF